MKTIYKYPVNPSVNFPITLPIGAEILCVQTQGRDVPQLWALVDTEAETEVRHFAVFRTGQSIDSENMCYIGTFQLDDGVFVFHLFERLER